MAEQSSKRLRIAHLLVQPVLMWDDGEELTPGPECQAVPVVLSGLDQFAQNLIRQINEEQAKIDAGAP